MRITFATIIFFLSMNVFAQQGAVSGTVIDQQTGEPLAGATVRHLASGSEVMTDFDGNFILKSAEIGVNQIVVSYVSYQEVRLNRVMVDQEAPSELKIKMRRSGSVSSDNNYLAVTPKNEPRS